MNEQDKMPFKKMMQAVAGLYYKPDFNNDILRVWFAKLSNYDFDVVSKAFDTFADSSRVPPVPDDIIKLCRHKVTIFSRLPSPLAIADNKRHADELVKFVAANVKPVTDHRLWAKKIINNPRDYPDISLTIAKQAMRMMEE